MPKLVPATFTLDLGKPATGLQTMGTGGLLAPEKNPGSYLFLTCADPATRRGVVAGWITHDRGDGVLFSSVQDGKVGFKAQIDYGHLRIAAGQSAEVETLAIGLFEDARIGEERFAEAIQKHYDIKLPPRTAVYCTWYAEQHGGAGDEKSTIELARFAAHELKPFGFGVVQIDDKWQDGPQLDGPTRGFERARPDGPYPNGIAPIAAEVNSLNLTLGLWWIPFGRNHTDPAWQDRQDWFAKWADGKPMKAAKFGGTCLDLTHPAVQKHLAEISRSYRKWGVKYYKMDGLWTGIATEIAYINDGYKDDHLSNVEPFHDPSKTQIEAYRDGMKLLRDSAGRDVFFSGCCVSQNMRSLGGSIGLVDSMRIGPDFNHDGRGVKTGPLRASRLYFLNGRVWWNDPDPTKIRASNAGGSADPAASGAVSLDMAQLTTSFAALSGQFFLLSDWIPNLPPERLEILKRTMLSHDVTARPVDYFDTALPTIWLVTDEKSNPRRDVLGLFNWEDKPQKLSVTPAKAGLNPTKSYHAFDFWKNTPLPDVKDAFTAELPPASCRVIALRSVESHPLLVSTARHVTQGIVDVTGEKWNSSRRTLSGTSAVIGNDPCELRVAGLNSGKKWKLAAATVSARDREARVTITPLPAGADEEGWCRVVIHASKTRAVQWTLAFE